MKLRTLFAAALLGLASVPAHAVVFTETQAQTVDGQDFNFSFTPAPLANGTDGTLTVRIRGDFSHGASLGESYDLSIESLFIANDIQATPGNTITNFAFDDNLFEESFTIPALALLGITADGSIGILVDYASGVSASLSADPFITVTLAYNTATALPEPGTLALLLAALGPVALLRRRSGMATGSE